MVPGGVPLNDANPGSAHLRIHERQLGAVDRASLDRLFSAVQVAAQGQGDGPVVLARAGGALILMLGCR